VRALFLLIPLILTSMARPPTRSKGKARAVVESEDDMEDDNADDDLVVSDEAMEVGVADDESVEDVEAGELVEETDNLTEEGAQE
jgi:hypothetical protein